MRDGNFRTQRGRQLALRNDNPHLKLIGDGFALQACRIEPALRSAGPYNHL